MAASAQSFETSAERASSTLVAEGHRLPWPLAVAVLLAACLGSASAGQRGDFVEGPSFPTKAPPVTKVSLGHVKGLTNSISGVPEYLWWYGCSPTASGMIIGWWDGRPGCESLIEGSAATWWGNGSSGSKQIVAGQAHIDAGAALGFTYGTYEGHPAASLADFMGTINGNTSRGNIGLGMANFCGWSTPTGYKRTSYSASHSTYYVMDGWGYANYCAEIDAGRPVHLGLTGSSGGHSVVGIGYDNTGGLQKYLCWTTYSGWGVRAWPWTGETETGRNYRVYAGTYLTVTPQATNQAPNAPTSVVISPAQPVTTNNLTATASGSIDPEGTTLVYSYEWAKSTDGGSTWSAWGSPGGTLSASLTTKGERWKARARASDGTLSSNWTESAAVTIVNAAPSTPVVTIAMTAVTTTDSIIATAVSTDADGDGLSYEYQWARSTDGGSTWGAWASGGQVLDSGQTAPGEQWKVRARAYDGTEFSAWAESTPASVSNTAPTAPDQVVVEPLEAGTDVELTAHSSGGSDAEAGSVSYVYEWSKSTDGGSSWSGWGWRGACLGPENTTKGEKWRARSRTSDGSGLSDWVLSPNVTIVNTPPTAPTSLVLQPATPTTKSKLSARPGGSVDPDGDRFRYAYEWSRSSDGGQTWSAVLVTASTVDPRLTSPGETWRVRACARDTERGPWSAYRSVTISGGAAEGGVVHKRGRTTGALLTSAVACSTPMGAQVSLTLSAPARVSAVVLNLAGRRVRTLASDQGMAAGIGTLLWNARSDAGLRVPAGPYLVQVNCRADDGTTRVLVTPLTLRQ